MDLLDKELLSLWSAFNRHHFQFIMVGGFAVNLHGFSRVTADADIWLKNTPENRRAFREAMKEEGYGDYEQFETMDFLPGWTTFALNSGLELDLMTSLAGFEDSDFDECMKFASRANIEGVEVPFLHINHLITEKKTVNRPKDQIDILELERIRDERNGQ